MMKYSNTYTAQSAAETSAKIKPKLLLTFSGSEYCLMIESAKNTELASPNVAAKNAIYVLSLFISISMF